MPSQRELKFLDDVAKQFLPNDPTPSLDEIQRQPDVKPQGAPERAPQHPSEPVRVVVFGTDAALSAVLTRLMRIDALWIEIAFCPNGDSVAAQNWQLDGTLSEAFEGAVHPVPLIRDDAGIAVAGSAAITAWEGGPITGEAIVDDATLFSPGQAVGAQLIPTTNAPGLAAVRIEKKLFRTRTVQESLRVGRALQVGGIQLRIEVDGVSRKRAVDKATFYRHLRDLQVVRPGK
nr:hypothetical protein [Corynebacterium epidermidicanis]